MLRSRRRTVTGTAYRAGLAFRSLGAVAYILVVRLTKIAVSWPELSEQARTRVLLPLAVSFYRLEFLAIA